MTWSAPMTAVAGNIFTAAQFNQYVRDNLLESAPAKATAAGQLFVSDGANSIQPRTPTEATVGTSQTTSSTSYTDLATAGPAVSVTTGAQALVLTYCSAANSSTGFTAMSYAVSGASAVAAADAWCIGGGWGTVGGRCSGADFVSGLTPGVNTFTAKYRVTAGTGTFIDRKILVVPL